MPGIQNYAKESFLKGLIQRDSYEIPMQKIRRLISYDRSLPVFYHYCYGRTHPHIRRKWYGVNSPVKWSPLHKCKVIHYFGSEPNIHGIKKGTPTVLDVNDNGWAFLPSVGCVDPKNWVQYKDSLIDYLGQERIKKILFTNRLMNEQLMSMIGNIHQDKVVIDESLWQRLEKATTEAQVVERLDQVRSGARPLRFLALISDPRTKCLNELLTAWELARCSNSELTIVAPPSVTSLIASDLKSVRVISAAPIAGNLKHSLYSTHDITISLTWVDGLTPVSEGIEYGHYFLMNRSHRVSAYEKFKGVIIDAGISYYDIGMYAFEWSEHYEYMEWLDSPRNAHHRCKLIEETSQALKQIENNFDIIAEASKYNLSNIQGLSLEESNRNLLALYNKCAT